MPAEMVFMMGLPAAGKSSHRSTHYPEHIVVDCDEIKKTHPDYDPKNPQTTHEWSQQCEEVAFASAIESKSGRYVIDGTGTNAEKMVRRMLLASVAGFTVTLVYLVVSLDTSLARNAKRERNVAESVIREKARDIATSFTLVAPHAQNVRVVDNN